MSEPLSGAMIHMPSFHPLTKLARQETKAKNLTQWRTPRKAVIQLGLTLMTLKPEQGGLETAES